MAGVTGDDTVRVADDVAALNAFLRSARDKLLLASPDVGAAPKVRVVMGNEAADLDSMVSAVSYAYLLQHHHGHDDAVGRCKLVPGLKAPAGFKIST